MVKLDKIDFQSIDENDNEMLVSVIEKKEIKDAVWSCERK